MSFVTEPRKREGPSVPLTALVDVLFLLLIFFIALPVLSRPEAQVGQNDPPATTVPVDAGAGADEQSGSGADVEVEPGRRDP